MRVVRWAHRRLRNLAALLVAGGGIAALAAGVVWGSTAFFLGASCGILLTLFSLVAIQEAGR